MILRLRDRLGAPVETITGQKLFLYSLRQYSNSAELLASSSRYLFISVAVTEAARKTCQWMCKIPAIRCDSRSVYFLPAAGARRRRPGLTKSASSRKPLRQDKGAFSH